MSNHFTDPHLCPVCWQNWVRGRNIYCSAECLNIAHGFLTRTDYYRRILSEVGFKLTKSDGIFFDIEIPDDLKRFYPCYNHKFVFPAPGAAIDCLSGASILDTIRSWLGPKVAEVIRQFSYKDFNEDRNFAALFVSRAIEIYSDSRNAPVCQSCGRSFIISEQSWDPNTDQCTDCANAQAAIPW